MIVSYSNEDISLYIESVYPAASYRLGPEGTIVYWNDTLPCPDISRASDFDSVVTRQKLEIAKCLKREEIARARWRAETGGLTLPDGTVIKTDRESQALLTGAAFSATLDPETPIEWKGANGWVVLMPQEVLQIAGLVRRHVQGCFSRERALSAQVEAIAQDEALSDAEKVEAIRAVHW